MKTLRRTLLPLAIVIGALCASVLPAAAGNKNIGHPSDVPTCTVDQLFWTTNPSGQTNSASAHVQNSQAPVGACSIRGALLCGVPFQPTTYHWTAWKSQSSTGSTQLLNFNICPAGDPNGTYIINILVEESNDPAANGIPPHAWKACYEENVGSWDNHDDLPGCHG